MAFASNQKMRYSWPLLLLRSNSRTHLQRPKPASLSCTKVRSSSVSSPFHTQSWTETMNARDSTYTYRSLESKSFIIREFSSMGDTIEEKRIEEIEQIWELCYIKVVETLLKFSDPDDIKREFNLHGIVIDSDLIKNVLEGFESNLDVAKRFFNFLLDQNTEELNYDLYYSLYNSMLCVFGVNGLLEEFWDLAETMNMKRCLVSSSSSHKEQRYLIDMTAYEKLYESFGNQGLVSQLEKLNMFVVIQHMNNSMFNIAELFNLNHPYGYWDTLTNKYECHDISVMFSGDFLKLILQPECVDLEKALILFRWIDGSDSYKHDDRTYHSNASRLGKDSDCLDKYWKLVDEIKSGHYDKELSRKVSEMGEVCESSRQELIDDVIKDVAVEFYEDALAQSSTMPSVNCCVYLLLKLRDAADPIAERVSWHSMLVANAFEKNGGILTDSMVGDVINMLVSKNKTAGLDNLADLMCHHYGFTSPDCIRSIHSMIGNMIDMLGRNKTKGLSYGDILMSHPGEFAIQYQHTTPFDIRLREHDRQTRARLIFAALQKEISGCTL